MLRTLPLVAVLLLHGCAQHAAAPDPQLSAPVTVDGIALLAPPPEPGTRENDIDVAAVKQVSSTRTAQETAAARAEIELFIDDFQPVIGPWFSEHGLPRTWAFFHHIEKKTKAITDKPKKFWKRPRPYVTDTSIEVLQPEASYAYPSGHSTRGTVYAALLAELIPERKEQILRQGRDIGWHRVIAGVHHPTDIQAGRVLGQQIARHFLADTGYQKELAEVRAEILVAMPHQAP